jgi:hypothetical protein
MTTFSTKYSRLWSNIFVNILTSKSRTPICAWNVRTIVQVGKMLRNGKIEYQDYGCKRNEMVRLRIVKHRQL